MIILKEDGATVVIETINEGYTMYCDVQCQWRCDCCKYGRKALKALKQRLGD